jgi:molecular chaperone IbpA
MSLNGGYAMRHFDLTPLYRNTIGFDRLFSLLDQPGLTEVETYPPYNIERLDETDYRITIAVAGFSDADLRIELKGNSLEIAAEKKTAEAPQHEFLHRGIAARAFVRRFQIDDHVQVSGASLENGLLHVHLKREIPEAKKPRQIPIQTTSHSKTIHQDVVDADAKAA